jgi:hypothetical protein
VPVAIGAPVPVAFGNIVTVEYGSQETFINGLTASPGLDGIDSKITGGAGGLESCVYVKLGEQALILPAASRDLMVKIDVELAVTETLALTVAPALVMVEIAAPLHVFPE